MIVCGKCKNIVVWEEIVDFVLDFDVDDVSLWWWFGMECDDLFDLECEDDLVVCNFFI